MAKKLSINIELPIQTKYEGLISIVAIMMGWSPTSKDENGNTIANPVTALTIVENFIKPEQKQLLRGLVEKSLISYYGVSQSAMIGQAMVDFDNAFNCTVVFEDVIEPVNP